MHGLPPGTLAFIASSRHAVLHLNAGRVHRVAARRALGHVHGDIGAAEQGPGVAGVLGAAGDANAGPDAQRLTVDHERALDGAHQALGHRHSHGGSSAGEEDGELVAAEARKGIPVAQLLTQVRTHFAQEQVPDVVPEGVVDLLEPVEVQ